MTEQEFIRQNGAVWRELEGEVQRFGKKRSRSRLSKESIDHFVLLYNKTANHLAYCRTNFGETDTAQYLNKLVGSAHVLIYQGVKPRIASLFHFLAFGFPALFRKNIFPFLAAALFFLSSLLLSYFLTAQNVENAFAFVPPSQLASIREEGNYDAMTPGLGAILSSYIGTNNIRVSFLAFALGITLGVGTAYVLITNGLLIGVLGGYSMVKGQSLFFWSLILPHGVPELFAIILCGAAGLMIGYSIIHPGTLSRKDSLITKTVEAVKLVGGCIPILIIAALIEGFYTPLDLPYRDKYLFSLFVLILLILYLTLPGRKKRTARADSVYSNPERLMSR